MKLSKEYTLIEDKEGLKVRLDSDELQIVNRDAYRMFVNRLIRFNNKHADHYISQYKDVNGKDTYVDLINGEYRKNRLINTKYPIDIDIFYRMNHRWRSIAKLYFATKEDPTGLKNIKEAQIHGFHPDHLELLKDCAKEMYKELQDVVTTWKLGTPYTDTQGREQMDYTEVAHDMLELSLLATHAYTDVFNVLEKEPGGDGRGLDKMRSLASVMHASSYEGGYGLPTRRRAVDHASRMLLDSPNSQLKMWFDFYTEDRYLKKKFLDPRKVPESTMSEKEKEELRQRREKAEQEKREADRLEEEKRKEEDKKRAEEERVAQEAQEAKDSLDAKRRDHEKAKQAFPMVPDVEKPSKTNQAFYAYFSKFAERMGIDPNKLNAQSIIQAASIAYLSEDSRRAIEPDNESDTTPLLESLVPIYEQIQRITYDAYIQKCLEENRPMDLSVPSNEALDLMSVVMYTMYPTVANGEKKDFILMGAIRQVANGRFSRNVIHSDPLIGSDALELAKAEYLEKDDSFFLEDAEARFEGFTAQKQSSKNIVAETASLVNAYAEMKKLREGESQYTATQEKNLKKEAMDAAYALEKRIETRYNTRLSRFFRYFSYSNQKEELARVKGILGIPQDQRVADHVKASRMNDLFGDEIKKAPRTVAKQRGERVGNYPDKYIQQILEKHLSKDEIPQITKQDFAHEYYDRVQKYAHLTPLSLEAERRREEERQREENERALREEQRRKQEEREKEERLRKEEEERIRREQQEKIIKEIEERERRHKEEVDKMLKEAAEQYRKENEERERQYRKEQEEEARKWQEELIVMEKEFKEKELNQYAESLNKLKDFKENADKKFDEINKVDIETKGESQKEIVAITERLDVLEKELVEQTKICDEKALEMNLQLREASLNLDKKIAEVRGSKKLKSLVKEADREEKMNEKLFIWQRQQQKTLELQKAIYENPEVQALNLEVQKIQSLMANFQTPVIMIKAELEELKPRKEQLEKDVNRINHELEIARKTKDYAEKALKYFEDNKDDIIERYASDEIGFDLLQNNPEAYQYDDVMPKPIYETEISKLELTSDPDPMKRYREI